MEDASQPLEELTKHIREEHDRTQRELREIALLVEQSRSEVDKLAQRNAVINNQLLQLEREFDSVPREDIRATYESAQDAQQRLFTMRGQLEKLQSDQTNMERYSQHLQQIRELLSRISPGSLSVGELPASREDGEVSETVIMRIIGAQEAERRRLSQQVHDGPAQSLTNFILQAEIVERLFDSDPQRARGELGNLKSAATSTFQKVRDFITELRPMMLDDLGLVPTVRRYVSAFEEKSGISTSFAVTGEERRMEDHREVIAFRGLQKLIANARDHGSASQIKVSLDLDQTRCRIAVEDNGRGFDVEATMAEDRKAISLTTLKEQVELLGGELYIESASGQGTQAIIEFPAGP